MNGLQMMILSYGHGASAGFKSCRECDGDDGDSTNLKRDLEISPLYEPASYPMVHVWVLYPATDLCVRYSYWHLVVTA